jgi:FkbM family methyltransferase
MANIYIDCGTHLGEGLKKHIKEFSMDESWKIYTFEANTFTYRLMQETIANGDLPKQYEWARWENITYYNKAVWIEDGVIDFYCSNTNVEDVRKNMPEFMKMHDSMVIDGELITHHQRSDYPVDGSSTIMPNFMRGMLHSTGDYLQRSLKWETKVTVDSFDFSSWLRDNVSKEDNVVCKLDIEGAEFEVLKKCIADDTLRLIDHLDVEFHHYHDIELGMQHRHIISEVNKLPIRLRTW